MAEIRSQNREEGIVNCRKNHGRIWSKASEVRSRFTVTNRRQKGERWPNTGAPAPSITGIFKKLLVF